MATKKNKVPQVTDLSGRLKLARDKSGLGQQDLAEKCGVNTSQIWRLEKGLHDPRSSLLYAIAKATRVSADWLLSGVTSEATPVDPEWPGWLLAHADEPTEAKEAVRGLAGSTPQGVRSKKALWDAVLALLKGSIEPSELARAVADNIELDEKIEADDPKRRNET